MVYKIMMPLELSPLMTIRGWTGPNAQKYLQSLQCAKAAAASTTSVGDTNVSVPDASVEGLLSYCESPIGEDGVTDKTFACYTFLLFEVLFMLDLLKNSIRRTNDMHAFDAARLKLMKYCWTFNGNRYGPRHIGEMVMIYHQVRDEVRRLRGGYFSFQGKGQDERLEEHNQAQKRLLSGAVATKGKVLDSSVMIESSKIIVKTLESAINDNSKKTGKQRRHVDQSENVDAMCDYLLRHMRIFEKIGRRTCITLKGNTVRDHCDPISVQQIALAQMRGYIPLNLNGEKKPEFPAPLELGIEQEQEEEQTQEMQV